MSNLHSPSSSQHPPPTKASASQPSPPPAGGGLDPEPILELTAFERFLAFETPNEAVSIPHIGPDTQVAYLQWPQSARWAEQLVYRMGEILDHVQRPVSQVKIYSEGMPVYGKVPEDYEPMVAREAALQCQSDELTQRLLQEMKFEYGIDYHHPNKVREFQPVMQRFNQAYDEFQALVSGDPKEFIKKHNTDAALAKALLEPYRARVEAQAAMIGPERDQHMIAEVKKRLQDLPPDEFVFIISGITRSALPFAHFKDPELPGATYEYVGVPEAILGDLAPPETRYRFPASFTSYLATRLATEGCDLDDRELKRGFIEELAVRSVDAIAGRAVNDLDAESRALLTNEGTVSFVARALRYVDEDPHVQLFDRLVDKLAQTDLSQKMYSDLSETFIGPLDFCFVQGYSREEDPSLTVGYLRMLCSALQKDSD